MPFKDTKEGQTNCCSHETNNTSGICNECLGKSMSKEKNMIERIFKSFCLYGKITEVHAEEIKEILLTELQDLKQELVGEELTATCHRFNDGVTLNHEQEQGYNYKRKQIIEVFNKFGIK